MGRIAFVKGTPTSKHLLFEFTTDESILGMRMPSVRIGKTTIGGVKHLQVMRYVYTLMMIEDVYFNGRKLPDLPGIRENIAEWLTPGQQIVSVPNGRFAVQLSYAGKKNIMIAHASQKQIGSLNLPFVDILGEDPAPDRILYGDPRVKFVQQGGTGRPTAAAYYDGITRRLDFIHNADRRTLVENFLRRFGGQNALAS